MMDRYTEGLRRLGVQVDQNFTTNADLSAYDLIHLYNFALPELAAHLSQCAHLAGKPYVVTTLYEDWPMFYNQMQLYAQALFGYVRAGQPRDRWAELDAAVRESEPHKPLDNSWSATHAAALLATGENEVRSLKRDYGESVRCEVAHLGCEVAAFTDDGSHFRAQFGERDFVLCVGRLETRKNQLMLLKALEESELTVVFAAGGFTYQPEYEAACKAFKRKGRTLFLERLSPELLSSAYAAARVHALPSWYELPGLVSLEAARLGCNVVVSDLGTSRDYFRELGFYARPDSPDDILNAVTAAYYAPKNPRLAERIAEFTWERSVEELVSIYRKVLGG